MDFSSLVAMGPEVIGTGIAVGAAILVSGVAVARRVAVGVKNVDDDSSGMEPEMEDDSSDGGNEEEQGNGVVPVAIVAVAAALRDLSVVNWANMFFVRKSLVSKFRALVTMSFEPLVGEVQGRRPRIRGPQDFHVTTLLERHALVEFILTMWNSVRRKGSHVMCDPNFSVAGAMESTRLRLRRVMELVNQGNRRFEARVGDALVVPNTVNRTVLYTFQRNKVSAKADDTYIETLTGSGSLRSDTAWVSNVREAVGLLAIAMGADLVQAEYIGAAVSMEFLMVSYGINPGEPFDGGMPSDFGIQEPNSLPDFEALNPEA